MYTVCSLFAICSFLCVTGSASLALSEPVTIFARMLWEYIKANLRHSFALWEVGERVSVLLGLLIAAAIAALPLIGISFVLDIDRARLGGLGLALWFVALMLVVTPFRLWREQNAKIATLEQEKTSAAEMTLRRKHLAKLDASGVKIRNEGMRLSDVGQVPAWSRKVSRWRKEAIEAIAAIDEADAEEFKTLNKTEHAWRLPSPLDDKHEVDFRCHDERLYRLAELRKIYRPSAHGRGSKS
jgi:hypothetical protein